MLKLTDVVSGYRGNPVLQKVSIAVEPGQIVAVIGANGAGKSTLLKTISGLVPARQGSITFEGAEISHIPPHGIAARGLTLVPEGRGIFAELTVLENLALPGFGRLSRAELNQRVERAMEMFPKLRQLARRMGGLLSGGEQQMVALGRAVVAGPKMLMLDEPSMGLAPIVVDQVFDLIWEIHGTGIPVLLVEQNASRALEISSYAYVLENGRVALAGPSAELLGNQQVRDLYLGLAH